MPQSIMKRYQNKNNKNTRLSNSYVSNKMNAKQELFTSSGNNVAYIEPPRDLCPGTVLKNRYELIAKIGEGGMGEVWKVHDKTSGNQYALKFVPQGIRNDNAMKRVRDTFNLVSKLNHTNICPVRFLEEDPIQGYFIVMNLLDGMTLDDFLLEWTKKGDLPNDVILEILRSVAQALDYAHSQKIIHRDIKPSNIFVKWGNGRKKPEDVWVIDFGLAVEILHSITCVTGKSMDISGTYPYMAPEQWDGSPYQNAKTDQYSLGVVAYEMFSGSLPFYNSNWEILEKFVRTKPVSPIDNVSDCINSALAKALAKKPQDRFESCTAFIDALSEAGEAINYFQPEDYFLKAEFFATGNNGKTAKNWNLAIEYYRKAAELGNPDAQYHLALCYEYGDGVTTDMVQAVKWYRKAAEQGNPDAQFNLAVCYVNGNGITTNMVQAVKWFRKAAEQGNPDAQYRLALCYENGDGLTRDVAQAINWYRKAAEQGSENALKALENMEKDNGPFAVAYQKMKKLWKRWKA